MKNEAVRLNIIKAGINGEGIGFHQRKPVFVEGCFPNEIVDVHLTDAGRHYEGKLLKIVRYSEKRVTPACGHAKICGSCRLMALSYDEQLRIKKELLAGALHKYCGYDEELNDIIPAKDILHYRNKANLPLISKDGLLVNALYRQGSNHPVLISDCPIHDEAIEKIRKQILQVLNERHLSAYDRHTKQGLRQLIVRGFAGHYQAVLVSGNDVFDEKLIAALRAIPGLDSCFQGINTVREPVRLMTDHLKKLFGPNKIETMMGEYRLKLSPQAFFQLNRQQAERIYQDVKDLIIDKKKIIIEAYCGIGAISLYLHDQADKLYGIEVIPEAIRDAKENAGLNGIGNCEFRCGDAAVEVRRLLRKEKAGLLVVDPPRTGLDEQLLTTILKTNIPQIIYVSCNPATLAKDLAVLQEKYRITHLQGYDMFPNTPHVETVCCLYHQKKDFISVPHEPKNVE